MLQFLFFILFSCSSVINATKNNKVSPSRVDPSPADSQLTVSTGSIPPVINATIHRIQEASAGRNTKNANSSDGKNATTSTAQITAENSTFRSSNNIDDSPSHSCVNSPAVQERRISLERLADSPYSSVRGVSSFVGARDITDDWRKRGNIEARSCVVNDLDYSEIIISFATELDTQDAFKAFNDKNGVFDSKAGSKKFYFTSRSESDSNVKLSVIVSNCNNSMGSSIPIQFEGRWVKGTGSRDLSTRRFSNLESGLEDRERGYKIESVGRVGKRALKVVLNGPAVHPGKENMVFVWMMRFMVLAVVVGIGYLCFAIRGF